MKKIFSLFMFIPLFVNPVAAQSILQDVNGDGLVTVVAFGDSISFGQGDYELPGEIVEDPDPTNGSAGYLKRVRELAGLATVNASVRGEVFSTEGIFRFPSSIANNNADIVGILEGTNDLVIQVSTSEYLLQMQKAINIAKAQGKQVVLFTILPTCCNHSGRDIFTAEFSRIIRELATRNQVVLADIEKAWITTCAGDRACYLFNIPDGLHPNNTGYDVIGQTFLASIYDVNIFAPDGGAQLEAKLGLEPGTVIVKPELTGETE